MADCLFCGIVAGDIPAEVVARDRSDGGLPGHPAAGARSTCWWCPRRHIENAAAVTAEDADDLVALVTAARAVAEAEGIAAADRGYRLVMNVGPDALNSVSPPPPPRPRRPHDDRLGRVTSAESGAGVPAAEAPAVWRAETMVPHNHLMAGLLGSARRAAPAGRGGVPRDPDRRAGQPHHRRGPRRRRGWPASSTSSSLVLAVRARGSTRPRWLGPSTWSARTCRPSEVLNAEVRPGGRGPDRPAEHGRPEALHRRHRAPTRSPSASARPGPASRTWRSPWPSRRSRAGRSTGSS